MCLWVDLPAKSSCDHPNTLNPQQSTACWLTVTPWGPELKPVSVRFNEFHMRAWVISNTNRHGGSQGNVSVLTHRVKLYLVWSWKTTGFRGDGEQKALRGRKGPGNQDSRGVAVKQQVPFSSFQIWPLCQVPVTDTSWYTPSLQCAWTLIIFFH